MATSNTIEKVLASDLRVGDVIEMYEHGWGSNSWTPIKRIETSKSGRTLYLVGHDRHSKYALPSREYRATTKVARRVG